MSVFTDEDREKFIEALAHADPDRESKDWALLARLECAERYAEFRLDFPAGHDGEKERLEAWLQSAGRSGGL